MVSEQGLLVTVCFGAAARAVAVVELHLPLGSLVLDAIRESRLLAGVPDDAVDGLQTGIWGRKAAADQLLRDGDRIELYRALKVDPKVARRERFSRQGSGRTGLFAKRRAGAKSGY